jgi:PAS domain S-box-containing protein
MTGLEDRQALARGIQEARKNGARLRQACAVVGISVRTLQRWQTPDGDIRPDGRPGAVRPVPAHALTADSHMISRDLTPNSWPPAKLASGAGLLGLWLDMMVGIDQPAYAIALDGRFLWVNPACEAFFGRSAVELLRLRIADITHPDDRAGDVQRLARLVAGDATVMQVDKRFVRPDGAIVWARLNVHRPQRTGGDSQRRADHLLVLVRELGGDDASREALRRSDLAPGNRIPC